MVLVSRTGRIIGVRKLASVPGSWHARNLYVSGESPLGQRGSSSFRFHVHRDLPANTIVASLVHHARPAAVPLGENPPVALWLQFESFLIISRHYSVVIMSTTNNDVIVEPSSRPRRGRI